MRTDARRLDQVGKSAAKSLRRPLLLSFSSASRERPAARPPRVYK